MKPILLTMEAFGSYDEKTDIPFGELDHGLYLITGDTGAGKTTIFDAIMFALYGTVSGTDREASRMHCDFSPMSRDTAVTFTFLHNGEEYEVKRTIHFRKKRGTEDEYGTADFHAELKSPGGKVIEGASRVTENCTRILGINEDQFRKIVMLAQGEFRSFLKAKSDEKSDILNKLFDNSPVRYYQQLLEKTREAAAERRKRTREKLSEVLKEAFAGEDLPEEERFRYAADNPDLEQNMESLIREGEAEQKALSERAEGIRKEADELQKKSGAAESVNQTFEKLNHARNHLAELEGKREDMARSRSEAEEVTRAWRFVRPALRDLRAAGKNRSDAEREIGELSLAMEAASLRLKAAEEQEKEDAEERKRTEDIRRQEKNLREQLPRFRDLTKLEEDGVLARRKGKETEEALKKGRAREAELETKLAELKKSLKESEDVGARIAEGEKRLSDLERELAELSGAKGIRRGAEEAGREEERIGKEKEELLLLTRQAGECARTQTEIYQRFIHAQAGIMAGELARAVRQDGEALCPVCGSSVCAGGISRFAPMPEDAPRQEDVEAAREAADRAERNRSEKEARISGAVSALETARRALTERAEALLGEKTGWEALREGTLLAEKTREREKKRGEAAAALSESRKAQTLRARQLTEQQKAEEELRELRQRISDLQEEQGRINSSLARIAAGLEEIRRQVTFPGEKEALRQIDAWEKELEEADRRLALHRKEKEEALAETERIRGSLERRKKDLPRLAEELAAAEEALSRVLREREFPDAAAAEKALAAVGSEDGESWIAARQQRLLDYENDVKETGNRIGEYEKELIGKTVTDLEELRLAIAGKNQLYREAADRLARARDTVNRRREAQGKALTLEKQLAETEKAWRRIDALGSLAKGAAGEGGVISFERYVMGALLREVLEMANRRISILSDGRYELIHQAETDKKNRIAGLEIEVLDHETNRARPSSSLSGGEGFYASLSLALGLSDVVQAQAGGRRLDALFIDEGFGSLDQDVLDKALEVLNQLTEGNRLVGIISHVEKLGESIPRKIRIYNDNHGSHRAPGFD